MKMNKKLRFAILSLVVFPLAACGFDQGAGQTSKVTFYETESRADQVSAESLLKADGFMSFAGLKTQTLNPMERHASAKDQVDPSKTRGHFPYTDYLRRSDMLAHSQFRQLNLEERGGAFTIASIDKTRGAGYVPAPALRPEGFAAIAQAGLGSVKVAMADVAASSDAKIVKRKVATTKAKSLKVASLVPAPKAKVATKADDQSFALPKRSIVAAVEESIRRSIFGRDLTKASADSFSSSSADLTDPALNVVNMRMGDYEDKTRLVLDLSAAAKFDYALDTSAKNVLTVHIDDAKWDLQSKRYFDGHPLIESYEVSESRERDVTLTVSLKQPSKMLMSGFVRPDNKRGYRIFFDMAAL